jgi:hypothetical protein
VGIADILDPWAGNMQKAEKSKKIDFRFLTYWIGKKKAWRGGFEPPGHMVTSD